MKIYQRLTIFLVLKKNLSKPFLNQNQYPMIPAMNMTKQFRNKEENIFVKIHLQREGGEY